MAEASRSIELVSVQTPIGELLPYGKNAKKHPSDQIDKIVRSIKEFGFNQPIVVDANNVVIVGHGRLEAAKKLGLDTVPVVVANLTPEQADAYRLADNRLNESEWDMELVIAELKDLEIKGFDISLTGFDLGELEPKEVVEDDFDTTPPETPKAQLGEIYQLGNHRLMCGDSTSIEAVELLMDGQKADMVFTDPPYGIDVVGGGSVGGSNTAKANEYSPIIGDSTTDTARDFYGTCVGLGMSNFVIWGGNYFTDFLPPKKCWVVWDKKGREWNDNFSDFELAWTSSDKPAKILTHVWMGMVQSGEREKRIHPTQKPAGLVASCLEYLGDIGSVFDGFGGSGSTLIACEQTDRKCYMMELDPKYVDVIIARWEKLTGKQAVKLN